MPYAITELYSWPPPEPFESLPQPSVSVDTKPLTTWGWVLIFGGLCVAGFFGLLYDTSVYGGGERVHNIGLQQNRMLGCIAGIIAAAVGALMVAIDAKMSDRVE